MKAKWSGFRSRLAKDIEDFLAHKRALKKRYDTEEAALRLLDRYLIEHQVASAADVTSELIEAFLISRPRLQPRSYNHLLGVVTRFFEWMVRQRVLTDSPVHVHPRRATRHQVPFLFGPTQAQHLLGVAGSLPDNPRAPLRGPTYFMIFALLYGLGLRVGEVTRLYWQDVDMERRLLVIRQTKFGKSRLVPFGPRMAARLTEYRQRCQQRGRPIAADTPVFSFTGGRPLCRNAVTQTFHQLLPALQLNIPHGVRPPRAHDLRHSFAVGTLRRWYEAGLDPGQRLLHLSTFLGHSQPSSTAVYLTITDELLQQASQRFERFVLSEGEAP